MNVIRFILLAYGAIFSNTSMANLCQLPVDIQYILTQQQIQQEDQGNLVACDTMPEQKGVTLLAAVQPLTFDSELEYDFQIIFLAINDQTRKVLWRYQDPTIYTSDAVGLYQIRLDTAPYRLNAKLRAVGLRISYQNASRVNPYYQTTLNLYDFGQKRKQLDQLVVMKDSGEWDMNCYSEWYKQKSIVQVLNTQNKGFADLQVKTNMKHQSSQETFDQCITQNGKQWQESFILKFDGKQYQIPEKYRQDYQY
ncbi:MAG: hypothetical protein LKF82_12880 [Acinetobacter populi]|uniref:hypothetical protein n=1 Tax=Acinetobacter populi TaxID=1582270 RepID=UPI0023569ABF|nr:hypothetical protein [Acinetobacter populi]MCH4248701.1 hypothetical protein [Acinetobacter populi]